jgi:hypothetical protein
MKIIQIDAFGIHRWTSLRMLTFALIIHVGPTQVNSCSRRGGVSPKRRAAAQLQPHTSETLPRVNTKHQLYTIQFVSIAIRSKQWCAIAKKAAGFRRPLLWHAFVYRTRPYCAAFATEGKCCKIVVVRYIKSNMNNLRAPSEPLWKCIYLRPSTG